jgi:hypothetical protein
MEPGSVAREVGRGEELGDRDPEAGQHVEAIEPVVALQYADVGPRTVRGDRVVARL